MAGWTVPVFYEALLTRLRARPNLAGVQVEDAWPGEATSQRLIWFGDARTVEKEVATARATTKRRSEVYDVDVTCEAVVPGGTARDARDAVLALAREVEDLLAEKPRLDQGIHWAQTTGQQLRANPTDDGWWAACDLTLTVSARIL